MRPELREGSELAGYRIVSLLARGGMGVVYLAEDLRLNRKAAVKVLAPEFSTNETFRRRFVRESELGAAIDHPNIIPVYGAGEIDGMLWIAMRYVEGTDLGHLLDMEGRLDPDRAVSIVSQVARALDAAHARGLVHRDVKPGNILIVPTEWGDAPDHVYLSDFGLTKRASDGTALTAAGQFLGTVDYVAPEQIEVGAVDGRADQYSLACVLFQCLTGRVPFDRDSEVARIYAHVSAPPPVLSDVHPDLPKALDSVLERAMAKKPGDRYPSCGAMMASVRQALAPPAPTLTPAVAHEAASGEALPSPGASSTVIAPAAKAEGRTVIQPVQGEGIPIAPVAPVAPPIAPGTPAGAPARRRRWILALAGALAIGLVVALILVITGTLSSSPKPGPAASGLGSGTSSPVGPAPSPPSPIYVVKPDGTGAHRLTTASVDGGGPSWSPDGRKIVFSSTRGDRRQLFIMNADGSDEHALTQPPAGQEDVNPTWSPDGRTIAFVSDRTGSKDIYVVDATGQHLRDLTNTQGAGDSAPTWSPDGTKIAFASANTDAHEGDILVMNADGSDPTSLISTPKDEGSPSWSKTGSIAFTRGRGQHRDVYVEPPGGGAAVEVSKDTSDTSDDTAPSWSPDGKFLVFVSTRHAGNQDLFVVDATGQNLRTLTDTSELDEGGPAWGSNGLIVYSAPPAAAGISSTPTG